MCAVEKREIGTGVPPRRDDLAIKVGTRPRSQANYLATEPPKICRESLHFGMWLKKRKKVT